MLQLCLKSLLFRQRNYVVSSICRLLCCIGLIALTSQVTYADHVEVMVSANQVEVLPGGTAEIQVLVAGTPGEELCLGVVSEVEVNLETAFAEGACSTEGEFVRTLVLTLGTDVMYGSYPLVVTASTKADGGGTITHGQAEVAVEVPGCEEYASALRGNTGTVPPSSTAVTNFSVGVVVPKEAMWTFAASNVPAGMSVTFAPSTILSNGVTQVRISVPANAKPGKYELTLTAYCNGVPVPRAYTLVVQDLPTITPTHTPSATPTATATATATGTNTPTATPTDSTMVRPTPTDTPTPTNTPSPTPTITPTPTYTPTPTNTRRPTPTPTETPLPDLYIEAIEVNQAIQNLANNSPLIAEKATLIRVYVRRNPGPIIPNVQVRLKVTNADGSVVTLSPDPRYSSLTARAGGPIGAIERLQLSESVVFPWVGNGEGQVTFEAEVNPNRAIVETNFNNNRSSVTLPLYYVPLHIATVTMEYLTAGITYISRPIDLARPLGYVSQTYPISTIFQHNYGTRHWDKSLLTKAGMDALWDELWWWDLLTVGEPDENAIWLAGVHPSVPLGNVWGVGLDERAVVRLGFPAAGELLAHEIGHAMDRLHINCAVPGMNPPKDPDLNYPYNPRFIASGDPTQYYGLEVAPRKVIAPFSAADFMTYCTRVQGANNKAWVSDYTYRALFTWLRDAFSAHQTVTATTDRANSNYYALSGIVNTATMSATINTVLKLDEVDNASQATTGDYAVVLENARREAIMTQPFALRESHRTSDVASFGVVVPATEGATRILIRHGEQSLANRTISANAPTVTLLTPNGGENYTDTVDITWSASDADGDTLRYFVQFSADDGATWQAVAVGLTQTQLRLDLTELAGGEQTRIRVLATDGANTGMDASDQPFTVATKPPTATLLSPESGAVLEPDTPHLLQSTGFDAEDGPLPFDHFSWSSDIDGPLGQGRQLFAQLSPGHHSLTVTAEDADGNNIVTTAEVYVGHQLLLPIVMK